MSDLTAPGSVSVTPARMDAAVSEGILSRDQADRLFAFWMPDTVKPEESTDEEAALEPVISRVDAEEVRFARGFHDVFISIGIVVFFFGFGFGLLDHMSGGSLFALFVVLIWGMSEVFARKLRLALPSFLLTLFFMPAFLTAAVGLIIKGSDTRWLGEGLLESDSPISFLVPAGLTVLGASLHYLRFRVPVGISGIVGACVFLAAAVIDSIFPHTLEHFVVYFVLAAGIVSFLLAMWYDCRDLERQTVKTDKAFWLHLLAAPLIVHSLLALARPENAELTGNSYSVVVIAIFLLLSVVAIVIDRRALLVSGLGYFGVAIGYLISQTDFANEASLATTLVVLGGFILLLGTGWRPVRRVLMAPLRETDLMRYVPAAS